MRLSGWRRLGIALSVLWVIAGGIWVLRDHNNSVGQLYGQCLERQMKYFPEQPFEQTHEKCRSIMDDFIKPADLLNVSGIGPVFWLIVLAPVVIAWVFVIAAVWIVRWIGRGFEGSNE